MAWHGMASALRTGRAIKRSTARAGTFTHAVELLLSPGVHGDRADEGDVHAERAVLPAAVQAHEHSKAHGGPRGVLRAAVHAV
eukprot:10887599-Prorocentrum_lima.AAC.1